MKRNTITVIELVIVICVIVVSVRVWTYKKSDSKPNPLPTPVSKITPSNDEQMSIILRYYHIWKKQIGEEKAKQKTVDWLNKNVRRETI